MNTSAEPTKEELAKAVYELSIMVGLLPSRTEKDWLKTPGHVREASKKGYQLHCESKK